MTRAIGPFSPAAALAAIAAAMLADRPSSANASEYDSSVSCCTCRTLASATAMAMRMT